MSSKIIMFPPRDRASSSSSKAMKVAPKERFEALPEWLQELDVEWLFKEDARRLDNANKR